MLRNQMENCVKARSALIERTVKINHEMRSLKEREKKMDNKEIEGSKGKSVNVWVRLTSTH